jgi:hypothetical protein
MVGSERFPFTSMDDLDAKDIIIKGGIACMVLIHDYPASRSARVYCISTAFYGETDDFDRLAHS